jgi:acetoin utilization deacetylase AcuC-like enzyme
MLPVFYTDKALSEPKGSFSPSGSKPRLVVADWQKRFGDAIEVVSHGPISGADLCKVHDTEYALGVLSGEINNGFGTNDPKVAQSCLYTVGGVVAAAEHALEKDILTACAPYSGFHHAEYDIGSGFCTFNGLVAAAYHVLSKNLANSELILDCDYHYGNGTDDILNRATNPYQGKIRHWTAGYVYHVPMQADDFFIDLPKVLDKNKNVDLILYQAGADPHVDDPLGGFLTDAQLARRDRLVFEKCKEYGVPCVWTLAGGYQDPLEKVLKIHRATMAIAIEVYGKNRRS